MNSRGVILAAAVLVLCEACRTHEHEAGGVALEGAGPGRGEPVDAALDESRDPAGRDLYRETLRDSGSHERAVAALRAMLRDDPRSAAAWRAIAQCHLDPDAPRGLRDAGAAVDAARTAVECLDQPDAAYLVTLGTAHYVHGDVDEAIAAYAKALDAIATGHGSLEHPEELEELLQELRREQASA